MRKITAHPAGGVVFGQSVRREYVGESSVVWRGIRIIRPLFSICRRIGLLIVERVFNQRFERLVVSRKWPVLKSAGNIQPAHAVWMQRKRLRSPECLNATSLVKISRGVGRCLLVVIGIVE